MAKLSELGTDFLALWGYLNRHENTAQQQEEAREPHGSPLALADWSKTLTKYLTEMGFIFSIWEMGVETTNAILQFAEEHNKEANW